MDVTVNPPLQVSLFRSETKLRLLSMFHPQKGDDARQSSDDGNRGDNCNFVPYS